MTSYLDWLAAERDLRFESYEELWRWSIRDLDGFWRSVWDFFEVADRPAPERMLVEDGMPGAGWAAGVELNYAERLLSPRDGTLGPALIHRGEDGEALEIASGELRARAGALAMTLREAGVERGDRVVAYLANTPEAVVGLIACASIGAIWSVCGPDFGTGGVLSRFSQLEPKVLVATTGYRFGSRDYDRREEVERIAAGLPSLEHLIWVDGLVRGEEPRADVPANDWQSAVSRPAELGFEQLPFDHPLWVLFSSGTTGVPKGITHSHGGVLLEHLKALGIQGDVRPGDRYLLLATPTWMVWNMMVSSMLVGATPVVLDGNPLYPDARTPWQVAAEHGVSTLGVSAGFIHACAKAGLRPRDEFDLGSLRSVLSTGSPLSRAGYRWVFDAVGADVWLNSTSGGTDVCSAFVGGTPLLPVREGRIQAPCLGVAVAAWDEAGRSVVRESGELVVTRPMPSMPIFLWGDESGERYRDNYFSVFEGVWRHGDFIEFDEDLSCVIHGRSDSTLNRRGVRIGSAEIYAAVEALPEVREALVVGIEGREDSDYYMPLFVEFEDGVSEHVARDRIVNVIRDALSPRHIPDDIVPVPGIPHTKTGKKLEVPVKRILQGIDPGVAADASSLDRPELLPVFADFAAALRAQA